MVEGTLPNLRQLVLATSIPNHVPSQEDHPCGVPDNAETRNVRVCWCLVVPDIVGICLLERLTRRNSVVENVGEDASEQRQSTSSSRFQCGR